MQAAKRAENRASIHLFHPWQDKREKRDFHVELNVQKYPQLFDELPSF